VTDTTDDLRSHPLFTLRPPGPRVAPEVALAAVRAYRAKRSDASAAVLGAFAGLLGYLTKRWGGRSQDIALSAAMTATLEVCADRAVPLDYDILVGRLNSAVTHAVQRARLEESGAMVPTRVSLICTRVTRSRFAPASVLLPMEQAACTPAGDGTPRELDLALAAGPVALDACALDSVACNGSAPDDETEERSATSLGSAQLHAALATLSKSDQWLLTSTFGLVGESFTPKELAAVEGVSANVMWRRINAAKERLRAALDALQLDAAPAEEAPYCHLDSASFRARALYWAERDAWLPKQVAAMADALAAEAARHDWDLATVVLMARRLAEYRTGSREGDLGAALVDAVRARCAPPVKHPAPTVTKLRGEEPRTSDHARVGV
jgi:hypothetical protein